MEICVNLQILPRHNLFDEMKTKMTLEQVKTIPRIISGAHSLKDKIEFKVEVNDLMSL